MAFFATSRWTLLALALGMASALGPVKAQDDGSDQRSVMVGGTERSFIVHRPANLPHPAPLVFLFHGAGGHPAGIERRTGMDEVADRNGFIVVYPGGTARPNARGGTWDIGGAYSPNSADDVGFVKAILHDLDRDGSLDHRRVYAAGFSMGGIFTYRLACEMSDTFAAIAPVSATMVQPDCHPGSPVAVLHIHGSSDDRIPLNGGRGAMTAAAGRRWPAPQDGITLWSHFDACAAQSTRSDDKCMSYSQCRANVSFCVVPGGGHDWPRDAAAQIWAFFASNANAM